MAGNNGRDRRNESPVRINLADGMPVEGEAWQRAIEDALRQPPSGLQLGEDGAGGMTAAEIAGVCGLSAVKTADGLRKLYRSGRLLCVRAKRLSMDGIMRPVPTYYVKPSMGEKHT
jgi:hypothetical protein